MALVGTLMARVAPERSRGAVEAATCLFEALLCYLWGDTNPNELVGTSKAAFFFPTEQLPMHSLGWGRFGHGAAKRQWN